jgi:hypothetical protein
MFTHDFSPLVLPMLLVAGSPGIDTASKGRFAWGEAAIKATLFLFWMFPIYFLSVKWHCLYLMGPVLLLFTWGTMQRARSIRPVTELAAVVTG